LPMELHLSTLWMVGNTLAFAYGTSFIDVMDEYASY